MYKTTHGTSYCVITGHVGSCRRPKSIDMLRLWVGTGMGIDMSSAISEADVMRAFSYTNRGGLPEFGSKLLDFSD